LDEPKKGSGVQTGLDLAEKFEPLPGRVGQQQGYARQIATGMRQTRHEAGGERVGASSFIESENQLR